MRYLYVKVSPVPKCALHNAIMRLRTPGPDQDWLPFWSCSNWPVCHSTRPTERKDSLAFWDDSSLWKEVKVYD